MTPKPIPKRQPVRFCSPCGKLRKQKNGQCKVCQHRVQIPKRIRTMVWKGLNG